MRIAQLECNPKLLWTGVRTEQLGCNARHLLTGPCISNQCNLLLRFLCRVYVFLIWALSWLYSFLLFALILLFFVVHSHLRNSGNTSWFLGLWLYWYTLSLIWYLQKASSVSDIDWIQNLPMSQCIRKGHFPGDRTIALEDSLCCTFTLLEAWFPIS